VAPSTDFSGNPTNQELALCEAAARAKRAGQIGEALEAVGG
jgi:hypothetical protein